MLLAHNPSKLLISGKSSSGKSTFFSRYLLNGFGRHWDRLHLFDHEGEFAYRFGLQPCFDLDGLAEQAERGYVVFDPAAMFPGDLEGAFRFFCNWTFKVCVASVKRGSTATTMFACDELQKLSGTSVIPYELSLLIETGRRYGIDTTFVSQQLNLVHNRLKNQLTEMVTFQHTEPYILDLMEEYGFQPDEVAYLGKGEYLHKDYRNGAVSRGVVNFQLSTIRDKGYSDFERSGCPSAPEDGKPDRLDV